MQNKLKEALENKVLVFDGAMGTEIYRRNFFVNTSYENLCVSNPKVIGEIHRSYLEAGAEVLGVASIFTYGMKKGLDRMKEANVVNYSLSNLDALVEVAAEEGYIEPGDKARLLKFRDNPSDESWMNK